jgi:hypothetical protein
LRQGQAPVVQLLDFRGAEGRAVERHLIEPAIEEGEVVLGDILEVRPWFEDGISTDGELALRQRAEFRTGRRFAHGPPVQIEPRGPARIRDHG